MARTAYPRPELRRKEWKNLNGEWEFEFDFGKSGLERGVVEKGTLDKRITVPFCPESELSGLGYKDFIGACFYRRVLTLNPEKGKRILLNFEAAFHDTRVYVNGKLAGSHKGGYTPFTVDMTDYAVKGDNAVVVYCEGDARNKTQPSGKQCLNYYSKGCNYTRSTGIYATVWTETVPAIYVKQIKLDPDIDNSKLFATLSFAGMGEKRVKLTAYLAGEKVGETTGHTTAGAMRTAMDISELSLWSIETPTLYDLHVEVESEYGTDTVESYFGMRKVELDKECLLINGKRVFQRLVLDQGFYGPGVYTAEDDGDFAADIKRSQRLGFNGARLHERVFDRQFLYEADRLGYIVWGEYANWGFDHTDPTALKYYLPEWAEAVARDYNHPALIGWCPFNETWDWACDPNRGRRQDDDLLREIYYETKRLDEFRPVIDVSGNFHVVTDIYDIHDYNPNVDAYERRYSEEYFASDEGPFDNYGNRQSYGGQPYFISEYGGIRWTKDMGEKTEKSWGYGETPKDLQAFKDRYIGQTAVLMNSRHICGLCYTQLYDVEQEQNGLYYYDRTPKFDDATMDELAAVLKKKAAIEE